MRVERNKSRRILVNGHVVKIWQKAREILFRLIQLVSTHWRSLHPLVMRQKVIVT